MKNILYIILVQLIVFIDPILLHKLYDYAARNYNTYPSLIYQAISALIFGVFLYLAIKKSDDAAINVKILYVILAFGNAVISIYWWISWGQIVRFALISLVVFAALFISQCRKTKGEHH